MKIWTTLTGAYEVKAHATREAAVAEVVGFLAGCNDEITVTPENWESVLADLNREMEEAGEAEYLSKIDEHDLPMPKVVVEMSGDSLHQIHTDSALLDGLEVAVITSGLDLNEQGDEVMEIAVGGGSPGEFTGGFTTVQQATNWDPASAYDAIEAKAASYGMKR